jgi:competence ComEA-like helix-hairpin-helix protein
MLERTYKLLPFLILSLTLFTPAYGAMININTASSTELQTLSGIGPTYAQRIIDYRTLTPFKTIDEIKNVKGIGDATFNKIKDYITVGDPAVQATEDGSVSSQEEDLSENLENVSPNITYFSSSPLSSYDKETPVKISAGRERLGSVGSPLEFKAEANFSYLKNSIFKWNFGDGSLGSGDTVIHTYDYPGEYVVVLNTDTNEGHLISRANVKIVEPNISILSAGPEKIEIRNNSKYEISLFGRALIAQESFVFPQDTVIRAGSTLTLASKVTGLHPTSPVEVSIATLGEVEQSKIPEKIREARLRQISMAQEKLTALQGELESVLASQYGAPTPEDVLDEQKVTGMRTAESTTTEEKLAALVAEAVPQEDMGTVGKWLSTLKRFFLRTEK